MCSDRADSFVGRIKSFEAAKGYGFIACQETWETYGCDVFFHKKHANQLLTHGGELNQVMDMEVTFTIQLSDKGKPQAKTLAHLRSSSTEACAPSRPNAGKNGLSQDSYNAPEAIFHGTVKSFHQQECFGFISCEEVALQFGRDVFMNFNIVSDLAEQGGLFKGARVAFTIAFGRSLDRPRANTVLWLPCPGERVPHSGSRAPPVHDVPGTTLAPHAFKHNLTIPAKCEFQLNQYAKALEILSRLLKDDKDKNNDMIYSIINQARSKVHCDECCKDEQTHGLRLLSLLDEVHSKWEDRDHLCHGQLLRTLDDRARPRGKTEVLISKVRFTQQAHSKTFRHGPHRGKSIDWLVQELNSGRISPLDDSMVLHVVLYHGEYRSLNNRHAVALVRYKEMLEASAGERATCFVRAWPLVRGLSIDDGSGQDVVQKFLAACTSASAGRVIESSSRCPQRTQVQGSFHVHVSNLDFAVTEEELKSHVVSAGYTPVNVRISMRQVQPSGTGSSSAQSPANASFGNLGKRSNGHGWISFHSVQEAQHLAKTGVPFLRDRPIKVKLDVRTVAEATAASELSGGWLRCKECRSTVASLTDTLLVSDVRIARDGTPARRFQKKSGFFCITSEHKVMNCLLLPHPDAEAMSFKLKRVHCCECDAPVGNLQDATRMEGKWSEIVGERAIHFKCEMVLLELTDCQATLLEPTKWTVLAETLREYASEDMIRLSQPTMERLTQLPVYSSGKGLRFLRADVDLGQTEAAGSSSEGGEH